MLFQRGRAYTAEKEIGEDASVNQSQLSFKFNADTSLFYNYLNGAENK